MSASGFWLMTSTRKLEKIHLVLPTVIMASWLNTSFGAVSYSFKRCLCAKMSLWGKRFDCNKGCYPRKSIKWSQEIKLCGFGHRSGDPFIPEIGTLPSNSVLSWLLNRKIMLVLYTILFRTEHGRTETPTSWMNLFLPAALLPIPDVGSPAVTFNGY